jgi:hypothetical protein
VQRSAVKVITLQLKATGKLPVSIDVNFRGGMGL